MENILYCKQNESAALVKLENDRKYIIKTRKAKTSTHNENKQSISESRRKAINVKKHLSETNSNDLSRNEIEIRESGINKCHDKKENISEKRKEKQKKAKKRWRASAK